MIGVCNFVLHSFDKTIKMQSMPSWESGSPLLQIVDLAREPGLLLANRRGDV